jgi:CRISPR/Cas system-associated exonuclease Cas4 (RecB family)
MSIYEAIEAGVPKLRTHEWQSDKLHISDLGVPCDGCPRQLWLRLHGAERRPLHLGELLMFDAGQRIHDRMVEALKAGGMEVIDSEKPTRLNGLTGRYDAKILDEGKTVIADFKTMRGAAFQYLVEPKPSHVAQVLGYVTAEDADSAAIVYIDREGQNGVRVFEIARDDESVYANIEKLAAISGGDIPPILSPILKKEERKSFTTVYVKQPWNCDYCRYQDVSCAGALPHELRGKEIAGRIRDGKYEPENDKYTAIVERLLNVG